MAGSRTTRGRQMNGWQLLLPDLRVNFYCRYRLSETWAAIVSKNWPSVVAYPWLGILFHSAIPLKIKEAWLLTLKKNKGRLNLPPSDLKRVGIRKHMMNLIRNYFAYKMTMSRIYKYCRNFIEHKIRLDSIIVKNMLAKAQTIQAFMVVT